MVQGRYHVYDRIHDWSMSAYSPPPLKKMSKVCTRLAGKATRKPFREAIRAQIPLQLIHSEICGPMNV